MGPCCPGSGGTAQAFRWDGNKYFYFNSSAFVFMVFFNLGHMVVVFHLHERYTVSLSERVRTLKENYELSNSSGGLWL